MHTPFAVESLMPSGKVLSLPQEPIMTTSCSAAIGTEMVGGDRNARRRPYQRSPSTCNFSWVLLQNRYDSHHVACALNIVRL